MILIGFSLFAAWKHGMGREDIIHARGFLIYTIICTSVLILFIEQNTYKNLVLSIIAIFALTLNLPNSVNYFSRKYELFRANNFVQFITDFSELKDKSLHEIEHNTSSSKLPQNIRDSIADASTDVYPWDYSIISANGLNWQPRVVLHSYGSYNSWLDRRNADHFNLGRMDRCSKK